MLLLLLIFELNSEVFYCISSQSPIDKLLIGKKINDSTIFNDVESTILEKI